MNFYSGVQHGHRVEITPLPKAQKNWPISHIIHEQKSPRKEEMATDWPEANDLLLKEVQSGKRIIVSDELKSLPANNEAAAASKKSHISDEKLFEAVRNHPLRIWVSRQQYARGLRIMNALHKALEERGFKIFKKARRNPSAVEILGEKIQFALYEKHRKVEKELNDFDKQRLRQGFSVYRYDYLPSGKLYLKIKEDCGHRKRRMWLDKSKQRVENVLNEFIIGLIQIRTETIFNIPLKFAITPFFPHVFPPISR